MVSSQSRWLGKYLGLSTQGGDTGDSVVLKLSLPRWTLAGVSRQCEMGISVALLSVWEDWHGSVQTLTEGLGDLGCVSLQSI